MCGGTAASGCRTCWWGGRREALGRDGVPDRGAHAVDARALRMLADIGSHERPALSGA